MKYFFNNKIYFDELDISNVTKEYVSWLNDKEVIKYSQVQYKKISINSQKKYLNKVKNDQSSKIFGIFFESEHIGNILIKNINQINKNAEISYLIGNKKFWGHGLGTLAVKHASDYCQNELSLIRVYAGVADHNIASKKVLLNNNFKIEGRRKKHLYFDNKFMDQIDFGKTFL